MVGARLVGVVEHVDHCHTEVHSQRVDHKEAIRGEQRQAIAGRTAHWGYRVRTEREIRETCLADYIVCVL